MILQLKNGIEIKLTPDQANKLSTVLAAKGDGFFKFEGQFIPVTGIAGIFSEGLLEVGKSLKANQWQCKYGNWHKQFDTNCDCGMNVASMGDRARGHIYKLEGDTDRLDSPDTVGTKTFESPKISQ